jgi:sulfopyruvate decarboxylase TPP-binding subunit
MPTLFSAEELVTTLIDLGTTHVVWVPDSDFGPCESALEASSLELVRVCREGEAWPLAAGLYLGGASPLVLMQTTGLFESGDALRNVLFDLGIPLLAIVGARNWLGADSSAPVSQDTARRFAQPILQAWGVNCTVVECLKHKSRLADHFRACQSSAEAGIVLLAEGPG